MHRNELQAILETLEASVKKGLNASLTPRDCFLLLTYMRSPRPKTGAVDKILQDMTETLTDVARAAIKELKR